MTDIPTTAREFERWADECSKDWPMELQFAACRALLTLKTLDQPSAHQSPAFMAESRKDLMAFAEAYGAWNKKG